MSNQKSYAVSFNTREHEAQGMITYTMVTIEKQVMGLDDKVDISLAAHPLYKDLEAYVLANPSKKG